LGEAAKTTATHAKSVNRLRALGGLAAALIGISTIAAAALTLPAALGTLAGAATFALTAAVVAAAVLGGLRGYSRRTPYW
jgi:hypothetical protein